MRGHGSVSGLVGIIAVIKMHGFRISFELLNNAVCILGVIFRYPCFNAGGVKDRHVGFGRVNFLADWLSKINKPRKDSLDVIKEVLFETGNFRGVRNLVKAAEFAEMARIAEKDKEKGIRWDGKEPLDDERP